MVDKKIPPRSVPERDTKYMGLAWMMAGFSKDPNTQVGALIVDPKNNLPLGWGYNGPPGPIEDDAFSWERPTKYDFVIHAEENAIAHSKVCLEGSHLYVTHHPCKHCMLRIVRAKIARVVYMNVPPAAGSSISNQGDLARTLEIASLGGVQLDEFDNNVIWIQDWMLHLKQAGVFACKQV